MDVRPLAVKGKKSVKFPINCRVAHPPLESLIRPLRALQYHIDPFKMDLRTYACSAAAHTKESPLYVPLGSPPPTISGT